MPNPQNLQLQYAADAVKCANAKIGSPACGSVACRQIKCCFRFRHRVHWLRSPVTKRYDGAVTGGLTGYLQPGTGRNLCGSPIGTKYGEWEVDQAKHKTIPSDHCDRRGPKRGCWEFSERILSGSGSNRA